MFHIPQHKTASQSVTTLAEVVRRDMLERSYRDWYYEYLINKHRYQKENP